MSHYNFEEDYDDYPQTGKRVACLKWANKVIAGNKEPIQPADLPYVREALTVAATMETPPKALGADIKYGGDEIVITMKGFRSLFDDTIWASHFLTKNRHDLLQGVRTTKSQMTETGLIKVIYLKRIMLRNGEGEGEDDGDGGQMDAGGVDVNPENAIPLIENKSAGAPGSRNRQLSTRNRR